MSQGIKPSLKGKDMLNELKKLKMQAAYTLGTVSALDMVTIENSDEHKAHRETVAIAKEGILQMMRELNELIEKASKA